MFGRLFLALLLLGGAAASEKCAPELCTGSGEPRCPEPTSRVSKPALSGATENVYFRNMSPHPAEILRVRGDGVETSFGVLAPGMRRAQTSLHGDLWRARAVASGKANGRLLAEHQVGAVKIRECDCPQPAFSDCSKTPFVRDGGMISDPIVFENEASQPVDLFYWNGTCEELVSWDMIGGVQPFGRKPMLSTQGHTFRFRSAASRTLLMAHTLDDVVIKGCSDEELAARAPAADGLAALRAEVSFFEREHARLRESVALEFSRLALALAGSNATATAPWAAGLPAAPLVPSMASSARRSEVVAPAGDASALLSSWVASA